MQKIFGGLSLPTSFLRVFHKISKTSPLSSTKFVFNIVRENISNFNAQTGMKKLQWSFFYNPYEVKTNKTLNF